MFCPNCGMQIKDNANFCTECGIKLQSPETPKNFCMFCGSKIEPHFVACPICGNKIDDNPMQTPPSFQQPTPQPQTMYVQQHVAQPQPVYIQQPVYVQPPVAKSGGISCPKCHSFNVNVQLMQENLGTETITKTRGSIKQEKHGCLWWMIIGWWWWIIDLFLWIFVFPFRFAYGVLKKKKYKTSSKSVSSTHNNIQYRKYCTCQNCGRTWQI